MTDNTKTHWSSINPDELNLLGKYIIKIKQDFAGGRSLGSEHYSAEHLRIVKSSNGEIQLEVGQEDSEELSDDDVDSDDTYTEDSNVLPIYGQYGTGTFNQVSINVISNGVRVGERFITFILKFTLDSDVNLHQFNERLETVEFMSEDDCSLFRLEQDADNSDPDRESFWFSERMLSDTEDYESTEYHEGKLVWGLLWVRKIPETVNYH